jgi:hypothetical protein
MVRFALFPQGASSAALSEAGSPAPPRSGFFGQPPRIVVRAADILPFVASLNEAHQSRVPVFGFLARASEARYTATTKRRGLDLGIFEVTS